MTIFQRIRNIIVGLVMILVAVIFIAFPSDEDYVFVIAVLTLGLAIKGLRDIIFYFTMARHMVGGKMILIQGVIVLDFALLTGSLSDVPKIYILLYLVVIHAFSGIVEILRAMEARRTVSGPWKMKFTHGIVDFLLAFSCFIYIRQTHTALIIYSIGLLYSAIMRILNAFRRTTFILIE
ncbi:MAG: hypothetical protein IJT63_04365 [Lachnospiraceae bacterium]|nr:hypothetical protein [Lachnospiraceae bacterium]